MVATDRIIHWLQQLVHIPSVGPANAGSRSGASSEARIAAQVADWLRELGGEVQQEDVFPDRPNTYAVWRSDSPRWIGVDVHIDTVGVETMQGDPFDARVEGGRLYGRGAVDTKASLAIVLALLEGLQQSGQQPSANLVVCASADEETGCYGAVVFAEWLKRKGIRLDELVVAEPTLCAPVYGHKGGVGIEFTVEGVATHSSRPHLGKNAIQGMAELVRALDSEHQRLMQTKASTELGTGTLAVTLIKGGQGQNVVPDRCEIFVDRRLVPGEQPLEVAAALHQFAREHCPLPVQMKVTHKLTAFFQRPDAPLVKALGAWSGAEASVVPYGTNAWAYSNLPGETVIFGPGSIDQAHRDVEWVEISELEKAAAIYQQWWGV